jgi:hypothetical protein
MGTEAPSINLITYFYDELVGSVRVAGVARRFLPLGRVSVMARFGTVVASGSMKGC